MKEPKEIVSTADLDSAKRDRLWKVSNEVLYQLCRDHPKHQDPSEIVAKIMLIGRAYAAAIERRPKKKDKSNEDFYGHDVVNAMKSSGIDDCLAGLPKPPANPQDCAVQIQAIETHAKLVGAFKQLAGTEKRALASKYLHFHRPDIFFIYDSRAQTGIRRVTPDIRYVSPPRVGNKDEIYWEFFSRCLWLRHDLTERWGQTPTPREIDNILLSI